MTCAILQVTTPLHPDSAVKAALGVGEEAVVNLVASDDHRVSDCTRAGGINLGRLVAAAGRQKDQG